MAEPRPQAARRWLDVNQNRFTAKEPSQRSTICPDSQEPRYSRLDNRSVYPCASVSAPEHVAPVRWRAPSATFPNWAAFGEWRESFSDRKHFSARLRLK